MNGFTSGAQAVLQFQLSKFVHAVCEQRWIFFFYAHVIEWGKNME